MRPVTLRTRTFALIRPTSGPLIALFLLGAQPLLFSQPAAAQSGAEDPTTAMARARFKEGVEFYDKGQYDQARAAFLQAYALKKHPAVLLNLAWSCLKSGHALEAERYFKQFLSEGKEITDKQRADANEGLAQSHTKLGRIEIAAPTGTEVTIDGERVGTAPISDFVAVEAGAHTVKFKGPDGATETSSVSLMGGEKVVARFTKTSAPPPPPPPSSPPAPAAESAPSPPPVSKASDEGGAEEGPRKEKPIAQEHGGHSIWEAPNHVWPSIVLWTLAAAAGGGAVYAGVVVKQQAQNNADQTAASIEAAVPAGQSAQGICNHPPNQKFSQACTDFTNDNNDVDADATVGNALIGAGAAFFVGGFLYWWFADKGSSNEASSAPPPRPVVAPIVGRGFGGLTIGGQF
jgi:hypothetical protein